LAVFVIVIVLTPGLISTWPSPLTSMNSLSWAMPLTPRTP